jgi:TPR repeat protein
MSRDVGQAIPWLRRAASQGAPRAFASLGLIHQRGIEYGRGVPKDNAGLYVVHAGDRTKDRLGKSLAC